MASLKTDFKRTCRGIGPAKRHKEQIFLRGQPKKLVAEVLMEGDLKDCCRTSLLSHEERRGGPQRAAFKKRTVGAILRAVRNLERVLKKRRGPSQKASEAAFKPEKLL